MKLLITIITDREVPSQDIIPLAARFGFVNPASSGMKFSDVNVSLATISLLAETTTDNLTKVAPKVTEVLAKAGFRVASLAHTSVS